MIVQVILDGHHLAPETAQLVWRTAAGRVALVTDAIAAAGTGAASSLLSGIEVEIRDGVARRPDGVHAGSVVTMIPFALLKVSPGRGPPHRTWIASPSAAAPNR